MRGLIKILFFLFAVFSIERLKADNIYIMNAPGYNTAGPELIAEMIALGHTVTENVDTYGTWPANFTSACVDPVNGYHWMCFFGEYDFSGLAPQVLAFIADGGKVYCNYEVSCCTVSAVGAAAMAAAVTGLPITPNANGYIAAGSQVTGGYSATLSGCITAIGNAYKGLDGLPPSNQLEATATIAGASPDISTCTNFGYFFTGTDIPGNTLGGSLTGMGDINVWYDGGEPFSNGGTNPVNQDLVAYFFPNSTTTCHLATAGCSSVCPFENVLGPDIALCTGESVTLDALSVGATGYAWNNGSTNTTLFVNQAGTYWVEVTDGTITCTDTMHVTVVTVNASASQDVTICQGLTAQLSALGGGNYAWTPATGLDNAAIANPVASPLVTTVYTVTVSVGNCVDTDAVTVTVVPANVDVEVSRTPQVCDTQGSLVVTALSGGLAPYTLELNAVLFNINDVLDLAAGQYDLVVTDAAGCMLTSSQVISDESYSLQFDEVHENPYCAIPGSIEILNVQNSSGSLEYLLNNVAQPSALFNGLGAGNFQIKVSDENGCEAIELVNLVFSDGNVQATVEELEPVCLIPGSITVSNIANAQLPYVISMDGVPSLTGNYVGLGAGIYQIEIQDADGCLFQQAVTLTQLSPLIQMVLDTLPQFCETPGRLNGVEISGGTAPYYIELDEQNFPQTGANIDLSEHALLVTDANGCIARDTFQVSYFNPIEASFFAGPAIVHAGEPMNFTNLSENADQFYWEFGDAGNSIETNPSHVYLEDGEFVVNLTAVDSEHGCIGQYQIMVEVFPPNAIYIPNTFTPDYDGVNDAFIMQGQNIKDGDFDFQIFNRYGDVVWKASAITDVWTGSYRGGEYFVPDGAYNYLLKFKYNDSVEPLTINGSILIIR